MTCSTCGSSVLPAERFCGHCGASLAEAGPPSCPSCRATFLPHDAFCSKCGSALPPAGDRAPAHAEARAAEPSPHDRGATSLNLGPLAADVRAALQACLGRYRRLLRETAAGRVSAEDFGRRAVRDGIVVLDREAWIPDLERGCWYRFNGVRVELMEPFDEQDPSPGGR